MGETASTRKLLSEIIKLANKGTRDDGQGLSPDEARDYEEGRAALRRAINDLFSKRARGTITPGEDALLDRLVATRETWERHKGKALSVNKETGGHGDGGKGGAGDGGNSAYANLGPDPLDVPLVSELIDDYAAAFGYGPYGNADDRLSTAMEDWARRKVQERRSGRVKKDPFAGRGQKPSSRPKVWDGWDKIAGQEEVIGNAGMDDAPTRNMPVDGGTHDSGMDASERAAWERKRYTEESAPVESGYIKWMDEVQWKMRLAREGDEAMKEWELLEFPKEAALWYRRMGGDAGQRAVDTQNAYAMGKSADEEHRDESSRPADGQTESAMDGIGRQIVRFGKATRKTIRTILAGRDPFASIVNGGFQRRKSRAKVIDEVWIQSHDRRVNGKRVKVRGHRRRVRRNDSRNR